jgi:hypothetical protein
MRLAKQLRRYLCSTRLNDTILSGLLGNAQLRDVISIPNESFRTAVPRSEHKLQILRNRL